MQEQILLCIELFSLFAANPLRSFSVQSSFKLNIPKKLTINSCNLQIGNSIGQGNCVALASRVTLN